MSEVKQIVEKIAFVNEAEMLQSINNTVKQAVTEVLVTTLAAIADTAELSVKHRLNAAIATLNGDTINSAILRNKAYAAAEAKRKREIRKEIRDGIYRQRQDTQQE